LAHAAQLATELAASGTAAARAAAINRLIWNDRIDALMTAAFIAIVTIVLIDSVRVGIKLLAGKGLAQGATEQAA